MARQRLVKPDVFQHEDLHHAEMVSALPLRLAFIGLWTQCDRRGCFMWKPGTLKLNVLPFDDVDFSAVLSALETHGFIRSYVVEGKRYGWIPTLPIHQSFNINEKPNLLIPSPPENCAGTVPAPYRNGVSTPSTGTGSSTGSSSSTAAVAERPAADLGDAKQLLTVAANKAIAKKFGEQTEPVLASSGKSYQLAEVVTNAGIPLDFATRSIARQVLKLEKPVRSMAYFRPGIFEDWDKHNERTAANAPNGPKRSPSPPVSAADEGVTCAVCRTTETEFKNKRMVPKHKPDCPLYAAVQRVGR